jgi:hypothetical protein
LYDFFGIAAFSGGKNGQPDRLFGDQPKPAEDFFLVVPEKPELAKEKRNDEDDDLVSEDEDGQPEGQFPSPEGIFIETHPRGGNPGNIGSGSACDGKSAKPMKRSTFAAIC